MALVGRRRNCKDGARRYRKKEEEEREEDGRLAPHASTSGFHPIKDSGG